MADNLGSKLKRAWNAFNSRSPTTDYRNVGYGGSYRQDKIHLSRTNERSIIASVYSRIALDVSSIAIHHVMLDKNDRFSEIIKSPLNSCLNLAANKDQTGRNFIKDIVVSMLDEGYVAVVPIDISFNHKTPNIYDIDTMRTGKIIEWYPDTVKINVYNDRKGKREDIFIEKSKVAIIENPFYEIMNEHNSTLQRLKRKLNLLDAIDEQVSSGKLDIIIQLPYQVKTELRKKQAEERRKEIERQLTGSKYGIAYADAAEHITQLNRPVENNLMKQVEYLTSMLYSQLGITQEILDGSANESTMTNYNSRVIEPIISEIVDAMKWKFLSDKSRNNGQSIMFFRDPFRLVPVSQIADIGDKMTRNEIMSSNELRQIIGLKPSDDPAADELRNKNLNQAKEDIQAKKQTNNTEGGEENQNGENI